MAGDTDLNLAIALAAAEDSEDDDFQQCGKQLALNKRQFLMGSSAMVERASSKRGANSQDRGQPGAKSRKCSDAGASSRRKTVSGCKGNGGRMNVKATGGLNCRIKRGGKPADGLLREEAELGSPCMTVEESPLGPGYRRQIEAAATTPKSKSLCETTPSSQQDVLVRETSPPVACSRPGILDSLSAIQESQSTPLLSNESQLNALLSLCSKAVEQLKEHEVEEPSRTPRTTGAGSHIESQFDCEFRIEDVSDGSAISDEEDITSLMTQVSSPKKDEEEKQNRGGPCVRSPLRDISNSSTLLPALNSRKGPLQATQKCRQGEQAHITNVPTDAFTPECPICGFNLGSLSSNELEAHTNACLDKLDAEQQQGRTVSDTGMAPVLQWLKTLNLSKYAHLFVKEEVDWDTLQWLQDEDLQSLGIAALGPRRKIMSAIEMLKSTKDFTALEESKVGDLERHPSSTKRITDFFVQDTIPGKAAARAKPTTFMHRTPETANTKGIPPLPVRKRNNTLSRKVKPPVQPWMCIPGTTFRVDAFRHLTTDCSHWFLTHFHTDHYQGLTRGFRHGKIYCSEITAALVTMQLGVPNTFLEVILLNKQVTIDGVRVTFIDANHCPGSVMILFELPNNEKVLHTGDFRYCSKMADEPVLQSNKIQTLILDTTYCDPQYDFPEQGAAVQFVIEAIQAEAFNPKTLFLIGTYTIGRERVFLEVARALQKKVYVGAAKRRLLTCMRLDDDVMKWLTSNDRESQIHVVPLWSIGSFKRMASISRHYQTQYNSVVAFSLTGWNFGRDKKRFTGRRKQQGTIVRYRKSVGGLRYEVPYSEHSSFSELKQFVELVNPRTIIPSVVQNETAEVVLSRLLQI